MIDSIDNKNIKSYILNQVRELEVRQTIEWINETFVYIFEAFGSDSFFILAITVNYDIYKEIIIRLLLKTLSRRQIIHKNLLKSDFW